MNITNQFQGLVSNFSLFRVNQSSIDLTASSIAWVEDCSHVNESALIDVKSNLAMPLIQLEEMESVGSIVIAPSSTVIVEANECIKLNANNAAMYQSVASLNTLNIGAVGGTIWIRPEWQGNLRIALHNFNKLHSYRLYKHQPIGQLVVFENIKRSGNND